MSTELGRQAEDQAALWLQMHGFTILARNWRTRWCEIDIVAEKAGIIHFVEVKYRSRPDFGTGFDYITADKKRRLAQAAATWLDHNHHDGDYQIDAMSVAPDDDTFAIEYLENVVEG